MFAKAGHGFERCPECGLVRMEIIPTPDQISSHYEQRTAGGNYDLSLHQKREDTVNADMFKRFAGLLDVEIKGARILDVGCFTGDFLDHAAKAGMETWGLELQPEAARIAGEKHGGRVLNTFMEDTEAFEPESFDCVAALGLIEHLADPVVLMDLVSRVLKPGGLLFIQTPDTGSVLAKLMGRHWFCYAPVEHIHYFSRKNLGQLLAGHGLRTIWSQTHWKHLEVGFVIHQMQFFGSDLYKVVKRVEPLLPGPLLRARLPFQGGEMMLAARKSRVKPA